MGEVYYVKSQNFGPGYFLTVTFHLISWWINPPCLPRLSIIDATFERRSLKIDENPLRYPCQHGYFDTDIHVVSRTNHQVCPWLSKDTRKSTDYINNSTAILADVRIDEAWIVWPRKIGEGQPTVKAIKGWYLISILWEKNSSTTSVMVHSSRLTVSLFNTAMISPYHKIFDPRVKQSF